MVLKAIINRLGRVAMATLAVAVGAATMSALGLVAYSVPRQLSEELRASGANMVVFPATQEPLGEDDIRDIDEELHARGIDARSAAYTFDNLLYNQQALAIMAVDLDQALSLRPYWALDGTLPGAADEVLVGASLADRYWFQIGDSVGLSSQASEEHSQVKITGIVHSGGPEEDYVIAGRGLLDQFQLDPGYELIELSAQADPRVLGEVADAVGDNHPHTDAEVVKRTTDVQENIAGTLQSLIWLVSAVISVLTIVSISTTLNSMITARRREIGLRKALGAEHRDIIGELLGEAVVLGALGSAIGVGIGLLVATQVSLSAFSMPLSINWWVIVLTIVVAVAIAVLGSIIPARRIANISPVDVLGGE